MDLDREVVLVRDGSFLGVVAPADRAALRAARRVARAARSPTSSPSLPDPRDLRGFLLMAPSEEGDGGGPAGRRLPRAWPPAR